MIGLADNQLAFHVNQGGLNLFSIADDIINDDLCVGVIIDLNTLHLSELLPDAVMS